MFTTDYQTSPSTGFEIKNLFKEPRRKCAGNVLVIDPDKNTTDFLQNFLFDENCTMINAFSLNDAVEKCKEKRINLVVSEFLLGDHSCLEIIMMLKKIAPGIPVAIMSGHDDLISEKDAKNFSADFFLSKPLQPEKLHQIIDTCVNQYELFS